MINGGTVCLVRDGRGYPVGMFGGGVADAVRGNPLAEYYAGAYAGRLTTGWALYGGGLLATVGGVALLVDANKGSEDTGQAQLGGVALATGLGALVAGAVVLVTAQPYLYDAINAYNDGVDLRRWTPPHPPVQPPLGTPAASVPPAPPAPSEVPSGPGAVTPTPSAVAPTDSRGAPR
jgi:hypothetical protein